MTIEQLLEQSQMNLLKASVEAINKDKEIEELKHALKLLGAEISILQCKLQRAAVPFRMLA
jgi:hypothetical protein